MINRSFFNILTFACGLSASVSAGVPLLDPAIPGQVAVRLNPGVDLNAFAGDYGIPATPLRDVASRNIYLLTIPGTVMPNEEEAFANMLDADPRTRWAELNYFGDTPEGSGRTFWFNEVTLPGSYVGQDAWPQIGLDQAQGIQNTAAGMTIAVVDSGVDTMHPALADANIMTGYNFLNDTTDVADVFPGADADGDGDVDESAGHGTHVSGVVAHIAPQVNIVPLKVLDSEGNTNNFLLGEAMFAAIDANADVMNVSIGSTYDSKIFEDAIDEARANGMVVVAAAGNLDRAQPEEYPALDEDAIGVAAVDENDVRADFTNFNNDLQLSAPGVEIFSAIPQTTGFNYAAWDGTSMATPMVSGAAALLMAKHPEWEANETRANQVLAYLAATATNIDDLNPAYAGQLGAGRINVGAALAVPLALASARETPTGSFPTSATCGDFNMDGIPDIAVAAAGAGHVEIYAGALDGTFALHSTVALNENPEVIRTADFNADTWPDLAVVSSNSPAVYILLNNQSGGFVVSLTPAVADEPDWLDVGDLDQNGSIDVVISDEDQNRAFVLLNNGSGVFSSHVSVAVGNRPVNIKIGLINGDNIPDIVTANRDSDSMSVAMGLGSGNFAPATTYATGPDPRAVAIGDLDDDGDMDLAAANNDNNSITIRWNAGNGTFASSQLVQMIGETDPQQLEIGDIDGDGKTDLVIASDIENNNITLGGRVSVLLNLGGGTLLGPLDHTVGRGAVDVIVADLDGDGDMELVSANEAAASISVIRNVSGAKPALLGDVNCDGFISVSDIGAFVVALTDPAGYALQFPACDILNADVSQDGIVSVGDIGPFVVLLTR